MWRIVRKAAKDFFKYLVSMLGAFILTVIIPLAASALLKRDVDIPFVEKYCILFLIFIILLFLYFFLTRLFKTIGKNDIHVFQFQSDRTLRDKILLSIKNENDEDFSNVTIELKGVFVGQSGNMYLRINSDKKYFSKGLQDKNNVIVGNSHAEIEIAQNDDGILKFLLDEEDTHSILLGMPEYKKHETFRTIIAITGKLDGTVHFSNLYEGRFIHFIDETTTEIIGTNSPKFISKIEWIGAGKEIDPIRGHKLNQLDRLIT